MKNKLIKTGILGYSAWGFYNGFNNTSHYISVPNMEYYTDRMLFGVLSGCMYVTFAPISFIYDIKKAEAVIRGIKNN
jgi:hypothetical protein